MVTARLQLGNLFGVVIDLVGRGVLYLDNFGLRLEYLVYSALIAEHTFYFVVLDAGGVQLLKQL